VVRLKATWEQDYHAWRRRDLSTERYVYWWADGIYFNVRLDEDRSCVPVLIGATQDGTKELLAVVVDGFRERKTSWGIHRGPRTSTQSEPSPRAKITWGQKATQSIGFVFRSLKRQFMVALSSEIRPDNSRWRSLLLTGFNTGAIPGTAAAESPPPLETRTGKLSIHLSLERSMVQRGPAVDVAGVKGFLDRGVQRMPFVQAPRGAWIQI
jgi:Transposase, Mutator family